MSHEWMLTKMKFKARLILQGVKVEIFCREIV